MCLVAQSCTTLCNPMSAAPTRLLCPWRFSRQEYWSGLPCPLPGDLPKSRDQTQVSCIAGRFFINWATREDREYGVGSLSLLQGIFLTQELNRGLLHYRWILYQWSYQGSPNMGRCKSSKLQLTTSHWNIHSQELLDFCKSSNKCSKETEK